MHAIKRSGVIIRPKPPFVKWANEHSLDGTEFSREYFEEECTIIVLIPECTTTTEARTYIDGLWQGIFEEQLRQWNDNEWCWPRDRIQKIFKEWFSLEYCSSVIDSVSRS
jgi:hypothetical protein